MRPVVTLTASSAGRGELAVVRTQGASLYDDKGLRLAELPRGAAIEADGRSPDSVWLHVTTREGSVGWVRAADLVAFGLAGLPVTQDFAPLVVQAPPVAQAAPSPAKPVVPAAVTAKTGPAQPASGLTGNLVFQQTSGATIYVYNLATGSLRPLTNGADPAVSPDGKRVAFWRGGGSHTLRVIDMNGANERVILTRGEMLRAPHWSPDGDALVFSHVNGENRCRDAGHGICLPDVMPYSLFLPLVTSDRWGLARVNVAGDGYADLATTTNARTPDWSPAGIYYGGSGIQVTQDSTDAALNRSLLNEYRYQDPAAQPGGDRVAFHSLEKDHWEIFTATTDGANLVALTHPDPLLAKLPHNVAPAWSPDGRRIVFLSNRSDAWRLWVMEAGGSGQRQLPIDVPIEYNYQAEQAVSWGK